MNDQMARLPEQPAAADLRQIKDVWLAALPALPLPGGGATLERWRHLAELGAQDVCLAKLLEAHYDAQAISAELGGPAILPGQLWAVWAAESPTEQVDYTPLSDRAGRVAGVKPWCSGADLVTHALMTVREGDGRRLVALARQQSGIEPLPDAWNAVGMARIASGSLAFSGGRAEPVGAPGAYLDRPGFWHGGGGIAACWYGAAAAIAERLRSDPKTAGAPHALAHLGRVDTLLCAATALLRETAVQIDRRPHQAHRHAVMRLRACVERTAVEVIDRVGRALGPGPLCLDRAHALRCADLQVFIRQSHAERDWEALGRHLVQQEEPPWTLQAHA